MKLASFVSSTFRLSLMIGRSGDGSRISSMQSGTNGCNPYNPKVKGLISA
jgi:hypothetical protein